MLSMYRERLRAGAISSTQRLILPLVGGIYQCTMNRPVTIQLDFWWKWCLCFPINIRAVKTDNGSIFTNYYLGTNKRSDLTVKTLQALDIFCRRNCIIHYLIDPGKPAQNGTVERSHREDQEKFYETNAFENLTDLQKKLKEWNIYYNNLEPCGLKGQTPNEFLANYKLINPPNVCA